MQKVSFPYKETEWREIIVILQVPVSNPRQDFGGNRYHCWFYFCFIIVYVSTAYGSSNWVHVYVSDLALKKLWINYSRASTPFMQA